MSNMPPALAAMLAEAENDPPALSPGDELPVEAPPAADPANEGFALLVETVVDNLADVACDMARVTPLEPIEKDKLASALLAVSAFYEVQNIMDAKTAAWFNLGMVAVGVIRARRPLPPPDAADAAPAG